MRWLGLLKTWPQARHGENIETALVPYELASREFVARFIYSRNHLSPSNGRPRPGAFNPSPHDKLSVAHSTGLFDHEVWEIGMLTLGTQPGRDKIYGRADVPVKELNERMLHLSDTLRLSAGLGLTTEMSRSNDGNKYVLN